MIKKQLMKGKSRIELTDEFLAKCGHTQESYKNLSRGGRWSVRNREKHYEMCKRTIAKNPEVYSRRHRKYELYKKYNLTEEEYNQMLIKQNKCCAICGTDKPTGKWKVFAVDHDHKTGKVRELLCNECNRGIGLLKDDPELLKKASNYIIKHNVKTQLEKTKK
jgi:hypothetical protein